MHRGRGKGKKRGPYRQYLRDTTQVPFKLRRKLTMMMAGADVADQTTSPDPVEENACVMELHSTQGIEIQSRLRR